MSRISNASPWQVLATALLCGLLAGAGSRVWAQEDDAAPSALGAPPAISSRQSGPILRATTPTNGGVVGTGPTVPSADLGTRESSRSFYLANYLGGNDVTMAWTGSLTGDPKTGMDISGTAGTISAAYQNATLARINWFRAMAGVPATITFDAAYSAKAQKAALMMAANNALNHSPPSTWKLYSTDGAQAANSSNISLGWNGAAAVTAYMLDFGSGNEAAGHRRWLLYPQTLKMGSGDIPWVGDFYSANAIWVIDKNFGTTRPSTRDGFVAWPPPGFVPSPVVFPRWSFSYPDADFSSATISMSLNGNSVLASKEPLDNPGYGENTMVWVWKNIDADTVHAPQPPPAQDEPYLVKISNVKVAGKLRNFTYTVTVYDPHVGEANYQPDLAIADWGASNWVGQSTYQSSLAAQQVNKSLNKNGRRTFKVRLRNAGNRKDTFLVHSSAVNTGFGVRYSDLGKDVTDAILAGTYQIRLAANARRMLSLTIASDAATASGASQSVTISAQSVSDESKSDAITASVKRP